MKRSLFINCSLLGFLLSAAVFGQSASIRASAPTHYLYVPTAYLNPEYDMVASLHEFSYALPAKLQLQMSTFDNVGRINFGARYGIYDNLSVGVGMAWSFMSTSWGGHAIRHESDPRLGGFLAWGITRSESFEATLVPNMQIGEHFSMGADYALMITPIDFWSIIGEFGLSMDFTDAEGYAYTAWGIRVHPPTIPFLSFDGGIDLVETRMSEYTPSVAPFFDVIFTMKTK